MACRLQDDQLSGVIDFDNLTEIRRVGEARIGEVSESLSIDLSGLEKANSATVALLIAWFRAAEAQEKSIVFVEIRPELRNIIAFSGLDQVLPLA
ncbi:MAG: STAS domain-containing protein [Gammaproteobacteria bacterium]|nr:STAS domain-containing protein [Gammaproteobacteria bacterium]